MDNSKIMIIEDDFAIRESLSMILKEEGAYVKTTDSSESAIKIINMEGKFDLIILDWFIKGRNKGWELIDEIRSIHPQTKIVVLSGSPDIIYEINRNSQNNNGMLIGVQKPILNFKKFIETVSNL